MKLTRVALEFPAEVRPRDKQPHKPSDRGRADDYARRCLADSLRRDESAFPLYTLWSEEWESDARDKYHEGLRVWGDQAQIRAVYRDHGLDSRMVAGLRRAVANRQPIVFRSLFGRIDPVELNTEGGPYVIEVGEVWKPPSVHERLVSELREAGIYPTIEVVRTWSRNRRDNAWQYLNEFDTDVPEFLKYYRQEGLFTVTHLTAMGSRETVCGLRTVAPEQMTLHAGRVTCQACLRRITHHEAAEE